MSSKSTASTASNAASTASAPASSNKSSAFARRPPVAAGRLTSEIIASDIAQFKQRGGRIEVLGNTTRDSRLPSTTFRPNVKPSRKAAAAGADKSAT